MQICQGRIGFFLLTLQALEPVSGIFGLLQLRFPGFPKLGDHLRAEFLFESVNFP
jgi:acyl dehydratase